MRIKNWRITGIGILLLGALALGACGGGSGAGAAGGSSSVVVTLSPPSVILARTSTQLFTATVAGTSNTAVIWTVDAGTISGSGNSVTYTAPDAIGDHTLVATSVADPSKSDAAAIMVRDSSSCAPSPSSLLEFNVLAYGAKGDGTGDDTDAIQKAVDAMSGQGGTVLIPSGTYPVDAAGGGILLKSNMTLRFEKGATLAAKASSVGGYEILRIKDATQVNIVGEGILQGVRNQGSGDAQGHGLTIGNNVHYVVVEGLTSRDCWGDGFYINGASSDNVTLCNVLADNNRRAGISITSVNGLIIRGSRFQNTHGSIPECGLNIEPNGGQTANNVRILACRFENNLGPGLAAGVPCTPNASGPTVVSNIWIDGNFTLNNGRQGGLSGLKSGIEISKCSGTRITGNTSTGNGEDGILLRSCGTDIDTGANASTVSGNTVSSNGQAGILEEYCKNNTITSNQGTGNLKWGIRSSHCVGSTISGNDGLNVSYWPN